MDKLLTPEEFEKAMLELKEEHKYDPCAFHIDADYLICDTMKLLGYKEGIEAFILSERWYD